MDGENRVMFTRHDMDPNVYDFDILSLNFLEGNKTFQPLIHSLFIVSYFTSIEHLTHIYVFVLIHKSLFCP